MRRPFFNRTGNLGIPPALAVLLLAFPAATEKRVALVVGNSAYQNITRLENPRNDATLMADTLGGLGRSGSGTFRRCVGSWTSSKQ
jgi:hypothetical protein